ncbi:hypothetical protein [Thermococcus sp. 21S7]|uniref:hypothetical protein n=1 Tax=Thermococcus sp. 21S7 TaxID=1638221 RepID=UPI00143A5D40|nr:hypothetical protein [Thermococcus sp. 21S7]NJE61801.1 hypothetical protein [Thermococcus sp. 21S7]
MEDMKELKSVLERVEGKLIAAGSIYAAMNFVYWLLAMSLFYVVSGAVELPGTLAALYWGAAILAGFWVTGTVFKRLADLYAASGKGTGGFPLWKIAVPWGVGSVVGWWAVPAALDASPDVRFAVGLLSFIAVSLLGQWALVTRDMESMPSFLVPLMAVPLAFTMKAGASSWAGFAVATGFSLTVLLYLHSAFRAIER